ncbi:uncharacterized protein LOC142228941 [Haematobia irritans]|uniref:uncharacterized protein LOC142228941 n=1 Tax=Haematobia irritans TaxID=7368 RepID=UPI003F508E10
MERWQNKIAVVTGASAGIGAATCKALVEKGMQVIGLARRVEKMEKQTRSLIAEEYQKNFHTYKCDVANEESVKLAFAWIKEKFGGIDVLINNAGIYHMTNIVDQDNSESIKNIVNTNVLGVVWCTREAFASMKERNFDGHVVIINSVAGHMIPYTPEYSLNIYPPTKYALTAMTEVLRQEFLSKETKIKITSISPGGVLTEILGEDSKAFEGVPVLASADVADAVVYCIQTPPHVQIHEMIIKPVGEKFISCTINLLRGPTADNLLLEESYYENDQPIDGIMERWQNKIAVVTGASAGIGAATCKALVEKGMIVVGLARRLEKMEKQTRSLIAEEYKKNFHCYKCNVSDEESVKAAFAWIEEKFGGVDVLINNAGIFHHAHIVDQDNTEKVKDMINTNVLGVVWCTREAFRSMKNRNFDGHIIIINSGAGHMVPNIPEISLNIYPSSKFAVTAMTEVLRQEFLKFETKIKITSISPGAVRTEILGEDTKVFDAMPALASADIADAIVYCIQTPRNVQIHEMIIKPIGEKV